MKLRQETIQGAPPPHQTAGNVVNGNPSRLASSNTRKGGYGKLSAVGPTESNTGIFHPYFFVFWFLTRVSLTFSWTIPHGTNLLQTAPPLTRRQPPHPPRLAIGALNIRYGWVFGLAQDIRVVERGGFDAMILTKTNMSTTAYFRNRLVYKVTCLTAGPTSAGGAQGGFRLVTKDRLIVWGI